MKPSAVVIQTQMVGRKTRISLPTSEDLNPVPIESPKISLLYNQGKMAAPNLTAPDQILGEGGSSTCRDEDPTPLLCSDLGVNPEQADVCQSQPKAALKLSDESPSRIIPAVQPGFSRFSGVLRSEPPKTSTQPIGAAQGRSFADVLKNKLDATHLDNKSAGENNHFNGPKNKLTRSFYDGDEPTAFGQILNRDGRRFVSFSALELEELVAPFKYALVGKFSHGFPSMKTLRLIMGNLNLKDDFSVSLLEERHVLIRLRCEEDYTRLWCRQVWFIAGFQMRVFKWTPDFCPQVEAPYAPVWVKFPYLPVHLFDKRSLLTIASTLGRPLRIDSATADLSRASTPRVCVEINLAHSCLNEVEINLDGKTLIQLVEYENIPQYCSSCKHLGHVTTVCKSLKTPTASAQPGSFLSSPPHPEVNAAAQQIISGQPNVQVVAPAMSRESKDDSVSLRSDENLRSRKRPTLEKSIAEKIRDDILHSYAIFPSAKTKAKITRKPKDVNANPNNVVECIEENNRIVEPETEIAEVCVETNDRVLDSQNEIIGTSEDVEGFIEVGGKNKKKKVKEKKNPS